MAKFHATLINEVEQELQDTSNAIWSAPELAIVMEKCLKELSEYQPYIMKEVFQIESRTGTATSGTTTSTLEDSTEDQFLGTDDDNEKVIYNLTDNTFAVVTSRTDSENIGLSKDIMADGEDYAMFNKDCWSNKQINIGDVRDYIGIQAVEFETHKSPREFRNWRVDGDILTLDIDFEPDDSKVDTSQDATDVDVYVYFEKRHSLLQFTDLAGTVSGTVAAGATTFTIAAVGSSTDTIPEDALFTVAGVKGTYRIYSDLELSGGGGVIIFRPGLESAPADGAIVSFIGSTLDKRQERLIVEMTAARAVISKGVNYIGEVNVGGMRTWSDFLEWGEHKLSIVLSELRASTPPKTKCVWPKE